MTKSFTAATVLLLRDEGRLRLDDPVATHVPELQGQRPSHAGAPPITLRHLLSMSAGFPGDDPWGDRQQDLDLDRFAEFLERGQSFAWMPGTEFEYSNLGYAILGRVISNVTGQEYRDVVRSRLLEPMGMTSTGYDAGEFPAERLATGYVRRDDGVRRGAVRRLRRVRVDGRALQHRARPRAMGRRVRASVRTRRRRGRPSALPRVTAGDAAGPPPDRAGGHVDVDRRAADGVRGRLRLRDVRAIGPGAREGRGAQRRLPGLRLAHAVASGVRRGRRRVGEPHVLPRVEDRRADADGARPRRGGPDPSTRPGAGAGGGDGDDRTAARVMGRRARRGHVLDERRHGRTDRAAAGGDRTAARDARSVAAVPTRRRGPTRRSTRSGGSKASPAAVA